jgi:dienelactone hydrolase
VESHSNVIAPIARRPARAQNVTLRVTIVLAMAGCLGGVWLMLLARWHSSTLLQLALCAVWVLSPFAGTLLLCQMLHRLSLATQAALVALTLGLTLATLAIYANIAGSPRDSRIIFSFIVVPFGSWFAIATVIPAVELMSRGLSRFRLVRWTIKATAGSVLLLVLGVTSLLGLLLFDHHRDTVLPAPTGRFAVGRASFVWKDTDPLVSPGTKRVVLGWIWYPAAPVNDSGPVVDYLPAPWRMAVEHQSGVLLSQFLTRDLSRVRAHSFLDAPLSPDEPAYPVVLMRGGGAALTTDYTTLAEDLASHGYVVAGFDVPYRSWVAVLPDGTVTARAPQNNLDLVDGPQADERAQTLARAWAADCAFVLDQLQRLNASDPSDRFGGRLDLERAGMFGHSLGGATALLFCHDDSRCKAGIDVDGAPLGPVAADGVTQPFMFILSDHSRESTTAQTPEFIRNAMANVHSIADRLPGDRTAVVTIRGANHFLFSDNGAMLKSPLVMRLLRLLGVVRLDGRRQIAITAQCIRAFFDVHLNGAAASQLQTQLRRFPETDLNDRSR